MGLFEDLGRKVGKLSHQAREASRDQAVAQCADCEELVYSERETCPECGSEDLIPREAAETDETDDIDGGTGDESGDAPESAPKRESDTEVESDSEGDPDGEANGDTDDDGDDASTTDA